MISNGNQKILLRPHPNSASDLPESGVDLGVGHPPEHRDVEDHGEQDDGQQHTLHPGGGHVHGGSEREAAGEVPL